VGGAELALVSWAETMAGRGHRVRVYNDPKAVGVHGGAEWLPRRAFVDRETRDVFVVFRSPNSHVRKALARVKLHWSTDQYTVGNYARDIFPFVDKVVCISPYHVAYHKNRYGVEDGKIGYIDLGVRLADYAEPVERVPGRCVFCSIADRGLELLYSIWPKIKHLRPDVSLVITGDYRLWGSSSPGNHHHRMAWLHIPDVVFLGKIPRAEMVKEQLAAQVQPYSCTYEELFCISAAECQVAGAVPVTPPAAALETTNSFGAVLPGNMLDAGWQRQFAQLVVRMMELPDEERVAVQKKARARFDWDKICQDWERLVETGQFPVSYRR
jgi:glycosyltransferase involved in cell wall biosynthesis